MISATDLPTARWRKSSHSTGNDSTCVEVANLPDVVAVRDSKDPSGPALVFGRTAWRQFAERLAR